MPSAYARQTAGVRIGSPELRSPKPAVQALIASFVEEAGRSEPSRAKTLELAITHYPLDLSKPLHGKITKFSRDKVERLSELSSTYRVYHQIYLFALFDFDAERLMATLRCMPDPPSFTWNPISSARELAAFWGGGLEALALLYDAPEAHMHPRSMHAACHRAFAGVSDDVLTAYRKRHPDHVVFIEGLASYLERSEWDLADDDHEILGGVYAAFAVGGLDGLHEAALLFRHRCFADKQTVTFSFARRVEPSPELAATPIDLAPYARVAVTDTQRQEDKGVVDIMLDPIGETIAASFHHKRKLDDEETNAALKSFQKKTLGDRALAAEECPPSALLY